MVTLVGGITTPNFPIVSQSFFAKTMEVIPSNKGTPKICFHGYMYTYQITRTQRMRWRCVKRTSWCKGTMTTNLNMEDPQLGAEHNHAADHASVIATKLVTSMKRKATSTENRTSQLVPFVLTCAIFT